MVRSMKKTVRKVNKYVAPKSHKQQRCRQRTGEDIALGGGEKKRVKGFLRNSGAEREKGMAGEERAHASVSWLSLI